MRGINTTNLIAGRIEMCVDSEWSALCHDGWDGNDARVACGILGFSQCKLILAIYTWACMHTITKSQLYTAETLVLVRVL